MRKLTVAFRNFANAQKIKSLINSKINKVLLMQAMKAYLGSRSIAPLIFKLSTKWGSCHFHDLAASPALIGPR
jgi:hypothetical protein